MQGCVETIMASNGTVLSPRFPNNYSNNESCQWKIITASGTQVQLIIHYWQMEKSTDCEYDSLRVFGGSSDDESQQISDICGGIGKIRFPLTLTSRYNTMFLSFTSDTSKVYQGFNATFQQIQRSGNISWSCNANYESPHGFLYSPGYPSFYENSLSCTTSVVVHASFRAALKFMDVDLEENCYDSITVYTRYYSVIMEYCNEHFPRENRTLISPDNKLIVKFISNPYKNLFHGFKAVYFQACDAWLQSGFGILGTPDFMTIKMLPNNVCNWNIEAPTSEHHIALIFTELEWFTVDERCTEHIIKIFGDNLLESKGGGPKDATNSKIYYMSCCGPPPAPIIHKGNLLNLEMHGISDIQYSAFYVMLTPDCVHQLKAPNGVPREWKADSCSRTIKLASGHEIQISFRNFSNLDSDLFSTKPCTTNFIAVFTNSSAESHVGTYCRQVILTSDGQNNPGNYWIVYIADEESEKLNELESKIEANTTKDNLDGDFLGMIPTNGHSRTIYGCLAKLIGFYYMVIAVFFMSSMSDSKRYLK